MYGAVMMLMRYRARGRVLHCAPGFESVNRSEIGR